MTMYLVLSALTSSPVSLVAATRAFYSLVTLREERRLRVFENMVLRRIFGHRRDEVTVE